MSRPATHSDSRPCQASSSGAVQGAKVLRNQNLHPLSIPRASAGEVEWSGVRGDAEAEAEAEADLHGHWSSVKRDI